MRLSFNWVLRFRRSGSESAARQDRGHQEMDWDFRWVFQIDHSCRDQMLTRSGIWILFVDIYASMIAKGVP